jgi:hypothetical protein
MSVFLFACFINILAQVLRQLLCTRGQKQSWQAFSQGMVAFSRGMVSAFSFSHCQVTDLANLHCKGINVNGVCEDGKPVIQLHMALGQFHEVSAGC